MNKQKPWESVKRMFQHRSKKEGSKKKKKKRWVILAVVLLAAAVAFGFWKSSKKNIDQAAMSQINDAETVYGDITKTITGTATIQPKDQYAVTSLVKGEVLSCTFEEGDTVKKGDVLYQVDSDDVQKNVESADLGLRRAQLEYDNAVSGMNDLQVVSDASGVISKVYVAEGGQVQDGSVLADIYDASTMELTLPFNESDIPGISVGQAAQIQIYNTSDILYGTVSEIRSASYAKAGNALVQDVVITVQNPGVLTPEDKATATIGNIACNDSGSFSYISESTITSTASGQITALYLAEGNRVNAGDLVAVLKSDSADQALKNSALSLQDAQLSSQKARDAMEDYTITAPISGTVVEKNVKAGDKLDSSSSAASGTGNTAMAIIYDMSSLKFDLNVDELDINKMKTGQEVTITADALEGKEYKGKVTKVSVNGTTTNGVTTYPVTVEITEFDDALLPGMNVDVSIEVSSSKHVLMVPITAVNRGDTVYVKGKKESEEDQAPEGYKTVKVTTGLSNEEFIEITSGLKEGDLVRCEVVMQSNDNMMMPGMGGGMEGGMGGGPGNRGGGGAPAGGGPGGPGM